MCAVSPDDSEESLAFEGSSDPQPPICKEEKSLKRCVEHCMMTREMLGVLRMIMHVEALPRPAA